MRVSAVQVTRTMAIGLAFTVLWGKRTLPPGGLIWNKCSSGLLWPTSEHTTCQQKCPGWMLVPTHPCTGHLHTRHNQLQGNQQARDWLSGWRAEVSKFLPKYYNELYRWLLNHHNTWGKKVGKMCITPFLLPMKKTDFSPISSPSPSLPLLRFSTSAFAISQRVSLGEAEK